MGVGYTRTLDEIADIGFLGWGGADLVSDWDMVRPAPDSSSFGPLRLCVFCEVQLPSRSHGRRTAPQADIFR
jgi:hypothetical protein